jgi:hypothetical protein
MCTPGEDLTGSERVHLVRGMTRLVWIAGILSLALQASAAAPPALEPPITATSLSLPIRCSPAYLEVVLRDTTGRALCLCLPAWSIETRPGAVIYPQHILVAEGDSTAWQPQPIPLLGDAEGELLALALPAVEAEVAARDSLRWRWLHTKPSSDMVEVGALRKRYAVDETAGWLKVRYQYYKAVQRGDLGEDKYAFAFFELRPPLRTRQVKWSRARETWTMAVEDSTGTSVTLSIPRRAGSPSGYVSDGELEECAEGSSEDQLVLLAAQSALRSPRAGDVDPHQVAAALQAVRERMARYIAELRRH